MPNTKEEIKTDLTAIAKLNVIINYDDNNSLAKACTIIETRNPFRSIYGRRFYERLQQMLQGNDYPHTCITCGNKTESSKPMCKACETAMIKGINKLPASQKSNSSEVAEDNTKQESASIQHSSDISLQKNDKEVGTIPRDNALKAMLDSAFEEETLITAGPLENDKNHDNRGSLVGKIDNAQKHLSNKAKAPIHKNSPLKIRKRNIIRIALYSFLCIYMFYQMFNSEKDMGVLPAIGAILVCISTSELFFFLFERKRKIRPRIPRP